jgi:CheY-specific phosphatase CheX
VKNSVVENDKLNDLEQRETAVRSKEKNLKQKETALKKQELELREQTSQLLALKTLTASLETKVLTLKEENRMLKLKLLASDDISDHQPPVKVNPTNHGHQQNPLNDLCTAMATIALSNLTSKKEQPSPCYDDALYYSVNSLSNSVYDLRSTIDDHKASIDGQRYRQYRKNRSKYGWQYYQDRQSMSKNWRDRSPPQNNDDCHRPHLRHYDGKINQNTMNHPRHYDDEYNAGTTQHHQLSPRIVEYNHTSEPEDQPDLISFVEQPEIETVSQVTAQTIFLSDTLLSLSTDSLPDITAAALPIKNTPTVINLKTDTNTSLMLSTTNATRKSSSNIAQTSNEMPRLSTVNAPTTSTAATAASIVNSTSTTPLVEEDSDIDTNTPTFSNVTNVLTTSSDNEAPKAQSIQQISNLQSLLTSEHLIMNPINQQQPFLLTTCLSPLPPEMLEVTGRSQLPLTTV